MLAAVLLVVSVLVRSDGLKVIASDASRTLFVVLPGHADADHAIEIVFPEHVTVRKHGAAAAEHLYLSQSDSTRPTWIRDGHSLAYSMDLPGSIHMFARAIVEPDGIRFRYDFTNASNVAFDMVTAVTDPRMKSIFHDERLERTYVHRATGFELLADQRPARTPGRYLASFTWPVPKHLVEDRDGIPFHFASRKVDAPFIATESTDGKWVVASFTRTTGNVWSNPELTCQHVDPEVALPPHGHAAIEVKLLVMPGSVADAYGRMLTDLQSPPRQTGGGRSQGRS